MDLNQLYFDHQLLLMKADRAGTAHLRRRHEVAASTVAGRIGSLQTRLGASGAPAWDALATDRALPAVLHFEGQIS
jgi:hypothetical protein